MSQTTDQIQRPEGHPGYCSCPQCGRYQAARLQPPPRPVAPPPAAAPAEQPAPTTTNWRDGHLPTIIVGLAIAAVGMFMPWATATAAFLGKIDLNGMETADGKYVAGLVVFLALIACQEARRSGPVTRWFLVLGALLLGAVMAFEYGEARQIVAEVEDNPYGTVGIGYGMFVVFAGAATAFVGAVQRIVDR